MGKQANPIGFGEAVRGEWMRGEEKERKKRKCIPCRHIPDTKQTLELVTHPPTPVVPTTSRRPDSLYNQGNIPVENRKRMFIISTTPASAPSLSTGLSRRWQFHTWGGEGDWGLGSLNTYIHFMVLTQIYSQIITEWCGKLNHGMQS